MRNTFPMDLGALSAYLKQHGYETRIYAISRLAQLSKFPSVLQDYGPDVIGFTGVYSQAPYIPKMTAMVKAWKDLPVLVGGKHATLVPEMVIIDPNVDGVCVGEGEGALLDFLRAVESGDDYRHIRNFWFKSREGGDIIKNPCREFIEDLDTLPFPDYEAVDYQRILDLGSSTHYMLAGRGGCHEKCRFCGVPSQADKGKGCFVRRRSVAHVLGEIEYVLSRYHFEHIYFRDDAFTSNREWTMEFTREFQKRFSLSYEILTRADDLDEELMDSLKESGCHLIWLGADSGNNYIREEVLGKTVDNETLMGKCRYLHRIGIQTLITNMVGLPYETSENFEDTIELNKRIYTNHPTVSRVFGACPAIFVFDPFPGTPLWKECDAQGWIKDRQNGHWAYAESPLQMPQFKRPDIYRHVRRFRYRVYKETNPLWAWWCLFKDSITHRFAPNLGPAFKSLESWFLYGEGYSGRPNLVSRILHGW